MNHRRFWVYLAVAITAEVTATLALRAAVDHLAWVALVIVGYVLSFAILGRLMRFGAPLGVVYGVWSAAGIMATALLGRALYGDPLSWRSGLGFVAVLGGVLLIEIGGHPGRLRGASRTTS